MSGPRGRTGVRDWGNPAYVRQHGHDGQPQGRLRSYAPWPAYALGEWRQVDGAVQWQSPGVNPQDVTARREVRRGDVDELIKAAGSQERRIEHVAPVGGALPPWTGQRAEGPGSEVSRVPPHALGTVTHTHHHQNMLSRFHAVHLVQEC